MKILNQTNYFKFMKKQHPLQVLREMIIEEQKKNHPTLPHYWSETFDSFKPEKREKKRIQKFLELKGHYCAIIENRGQRIDTRQTVYLDECVGKTIGTVTWTKSGMRKGKADLSAIINSKALEIEIKRIYQKGKDKQSDDQIEEQKRIEKAGGIYLIVSGYNEFFEWYNNNISKF